jgi:hypothetical protein
MRCRDFVAGLLLAGAGRRRATRRGEQQQRSGAPQHGAASFKLMSQFVTLRHAGGL